LIFIKGDTLYSTRHNDIKHRNGGMFSGKIGCNEMIAG